HVETGGVFQAENELAIRKLIDTRELKLDDCSQQGRESRAEIATERLVHRLQRAHLLLADALRPLEIVGRNFIAMLDATRGRVGDYVRLAAIHRAQETFNFRLAENVATHCALLCGGKWSRGVDQKT